jgi:tetratricopeptide (TPR) repeat protein
MDSSSGNKKKIQKTNKKEAIADTLKRMFALVEENSQSDIVVVDLNDHVDKRLSLTFKLAMVDVRCVLKEGFHDKAWRMISQSLLEGARGNSHQDDIILSIAMQKYTEMLNSLEQVCKKFRLHDYATFWSHSLVCLGDLKQHFKEYKQALDCYDQALVLSPGDGHIHYKVACISELLNEDGIYTIYHYFRCLCSLEKHEIPSDKILSLLQSETHKAGNDRDGQVLSAIEKLYVKNDINSVDAKVISDCIVKSMLDNYIELIFILMSVFQLNSKDEENDSDKSKEVGFKISHIFMLLFNESISSIRETERVNEIMRICELLCAWFISNVSLITKYLDGCDAEYAEGFELFLRTVSKEARKVDQSSHTPLETLKFWPLRIICSDFDSLDKALGKGLKLKQLMSLEASLSQLALKFKETNKEKTYFEHFLLILVKESRWFDENYSVRTDILANIQKARTTPQKEKPTQTKKKRAKSNTKKSSKKNELLEGINNISLDDTSVGLSPSLPLGFEASNLQQNTDNDEVDIIVLDTNVYIAIELTHIEALLLDVNAPYLIILPLVVIKELKGLSGKYPRTEMYLDRLKRLLTLNKRLPLLLMSSSGEYLKSFEYQRESRDHETGMNNDDLIVQCCKLCMENPPVLLKRKYGKGVTLVTNDVNMKLKAMAESVQVTDSAAFVRKFVNKK